MAYQSFIAKLLLVVCLVVRATQGDSEPEGLRPSPRIVTGSKAAKGQFPYQVSIRVGGKHSCGGALINQNFVVTAAHCVYSIPPSFITVQAGTINRTEEGIITEVVKVIPHPDYYYDNDLALLELKTALEYNDVVQPITLGALEVPAGEKVTISGWGRTSDGGPLSEILLYSRSLSIQSNEQCARVDGPVNPGIQCLSKDIYNGFCDGDDGGPAVHKGVLIGVASYYAGSCGSSAPDGYTKISYYRKWLVQNSAPTVPV